MFVGDPPKQNEVFLSAFLSDRPTRGTPQKKTYPFHEASPPFNLTSLKQATMEVQRKICPPQAEPVLKGSICFFLFFFLF